MRHQHLGFSALFLVFAAGCSSSSGTGVVPVTGQTGTVSGGGAMNAAGASNGGASTGGVSAGTGGASGAVTGGSGGSAGDPNTCTPACGTGKACVMGTCLTAPTTLTTIAGCTTVRLAAKGDTLYFTDGAHGSVRKIPIAGGMPSDVVTGQMNPYALVVDATNVYFGNDGDFTLKFAPLAGTTAKTITTGMTAGTKGLALAGNVLFYADSHNLNSVATAENSTPTVLGQGDTGGKGLPSEIALDATNVYYTDANAFGVERHPQVGTGSSVAMVGSQGDLVMSALAVQAGNIYFANGSNLDSEIVTAAQASGGSYATITSSVQGFNFTGFTMNGTDVYLGEDGFVETSSVAVGSTASIAAVNQPMPQSFVVDATNVYWVTLDTSQNCTIEELPRK
jgi:hypothetical protein